MPNPWYMLPLFLWARVVLTMGILLYSIESYQLAIRDPEIRRPLSHIYTMVWAVIALGLRVVLTFNPGMFDSYEWLELHWVQIGMVLVIVFQFLMSRENNKIWKHSG